MLANTNNLGNFFASSTLLQRVLFQFLQWSEMAPLKLLYSRLMALLIQLLLLRLIPFLEEISNVTLDTCNAFLTKTFDFREAFQKENLNG